MNEPKKGRLALRRLLHESSYPKIQEISSLLDESGYVLGRGMLYIPRYVRYTIFGTEELPEGKKHRTADIVANVPSCNETMSVQLGGFIISQIGTDKPKLAIAVHSKQAVEEKQAIADAFEQKRLALRELPDGQQRVSHLSLAEIDRDSCGYFTEDLLMSLNEQVGATISDMGVFMGNVVLRSVSPPGN